MNIETVSLTPTHGEKIIYNQALYAVNIKDTSISSPQKLDGQHLQTKWYCENKYLL